MHAHDIVLICGIAVIGFACSWVAWRLKLPAILFLLFAGVLVGPVFAVLDPDALLGSLLKPIVSVAVAIILFEGSLTLKLSEIRGHGSVVSNLVSFGVLLTWVVAGLAAYYVMGWDIYLSALFGAVVTVSGPTVVMPLLRAVRPKPAVSSILRWEAILIDPIGAILALLVFNAIVASQQQSDFAHIVAEFGIIVGVGVVLGAVGGYAYGIALRKRVIPDYLRDYSGLAAVLLVFAAAEYLQAESGFLAVTIMGIWLANMRDVDLADILNFKESVTLVLIGGLFILLAARLDLEALAALGSGGIVVVLVLQLLAGPARAFISAVGADISWKEKLFIGWVFPRGIVAAAVSSLFALRLSDIGYPNAEALVPLVFSLIIGTVVLQSLTAKPVAKLLGVAEPEPTGVLVVGSNLLGRTIAKAIADAGLSVRVADSHWAGIREARMMGLPTFYGSPVSNYSEDNLDTAGLGNLLAVSRQPGLNELACVRFAADFGRDHVFVLTSMWEKGHEKHNVSGEVSGRRLFNGDVKIDELIRRIKSGAKIKQNSLTEEFTYEAYREKNPDNLVLFAIDDKQRIHFPVPDEEATPSKGWTVVALMGSTGDSETAENK